MPILSSFVIINHSLDFGGCAMKKKPTINIDKPEHIVTLDQSWHQLFGDKKSIKIKSLEKKLNKLLGQQGKANTEYKEYQLLKKKLLAEIVEHMDAKNKGDADALKLVSKNQKYVDDINKKLESYEKEKTGLPQVIDATNKALLEESMFQCYEVMIANKENKEALEAEIDSMREHLLKKVSEKDALDKEISRLYTFMHDIAGIDVIEQLDRYYFGGKE